MPKAFSTALRCAPKNEPRSRMYASRMGASTVSRDSMDLRARGAASSGLGGVTAGGGGSGGATMSSKLVTAIVEGTNCDCPIRLSGCGGRLRRVRTSSTMTAPVFDHSAAVWAASVIWAR